MMARCYRPKLVFMIGVFIVLGSIVLPSVTAAAPSSLPVRPTPMPTATPFLVPTLTPVPRISTTHDVVGGMIVLQVNGGAEPGIDWQALFTVVQWQDALGTWHTIEGWQGTCDEVVTGIGYKTWWVSTEMLGNGPFRWLVYDRQGGRLMATSVPFSLPVKGGEQVNVVVTLSSTATPILLPETGNVPLSVAGLMVLSVFLLLSGGIMLRMRRHS
ncbi:MAG: hypothetical protein JXA33_07715 [Anaerolineae bacterium]|nr:hypothetical protein [Anaerolineae bacterium]